MIALAAALLASAPTLRLPGLDGRELAARRVPADFEQFDREVLCAVVTPAERGPMRLVVVDDPEVRQRHRSCSLGAIRRELTDWVAILAAGTASIADLRRLEARATASLLARSDVQCVYHLAPLALPQAHPIVVVQREVIEAVGRRRFLRALWEAEVAVGAQGSEQEVGALYDEFAERVRRHLARALDGSARGA